jgi:hypothetical protein
MLTDLVAVEELDLAAPLAQVGDQEIGDRALPGAGKAREPHTAAGQVTHGGAEYGKHRAAPSVVRLLGD